MLKWRTVAISLSYAVATLALAACRTTTPDAPVRAGKVEAAADTPVVVVAEFLSYAPFKSFLMTAEDAAGTYYSVVAKASFAIKADGSLSLLESGAEPTIGSDTDNATDFDCATHGGGYNQRTAWFPYTALFVHGGSLEKVTTAKGAARVQRVLSIDAEDGSVVYRGADARDTEYSFVPCVGAQRAAPGVRLDTYLAGDDRLMLRKSNGERLRLRLPQPFASFVLARYQDGAMIPVPMRIVVASIDLAERRVVLQLQTTIAMSPPISRLELRAILKQGEPGDGESAAQYRERTSALMADLAACAPPLVQAIEPCANPSRRPDPRIFASGLVSKD